MRYNTSPTIWAWYAHLQSWSVKTGRPVVKGQILGVSGCTGNCSGPHVHVAWVTDASLDPYGEVGNGKPHHQWPLTTCSGLKSGSKRRVYRRLKPGEVVLGGKGKC